MVRQSLVVAIMGISTMMMGQTAKPVDPLHAWVGLKSAGDLATWANWHLAEEQRLLSELTAVKGPRTEENTLKLYDEAQFHLMIAGNQVNLLFETHANKAIRDKAQALIPQVAAAGVALSLNQDVYHALSAIDSKKQDAATKHYLERQLLEYRLAGVDKDQATRDKVKRLSDEMTQTSLEFSRNIQDDVRKIAVKDKSELDGLPGDYLKGTRRARMERLR